MVLHVAIPDVAYWTAMRIAALPISPLFVACLLLPAQAADQTNPYKFPVAKGARLPIAECFWASPPSACQDLKIVDAKRPHVGFKGFDFPDHHEGVEFAYLGPRLSNWPDGICFVLRIALEGPRGRYRIKGVCGDSDRFWGTAEVGSASVVVLTRRDKYETQTKTFGLCEEIKQ